jgi:hypothetical protein
VEAKYDPENLRHTGARHELWYGEAKPCSMYGHHEDWRHVLAYKSLDAKLIRAVKEKNEKMESAI